MKLADVTTVRGKPKMKLSAPRSYRTRERNRRIIGVVVLMLIVATIAYFGRHLVGHS